MSGEPGATSGPPGPEAEDGALDPTASKTWQTLRGLAARDLPPVSALFEKEPSRLETMCLRPFDDLVADLSKQRVDAATWSALAALAVERRVPEAIQAMCRGERLNVTEDRAALHVALRASAGSAFELDGVDVANVARAERARVGAFVEAVRTGSFAPAMAAASHM